MKKKMLVFVAVGALMIAQPQFVKAHDLKPLLSGFFMQLEGRYVMSDGDETPFAMDNTGRVFDLDLDGEDTTARFGMGMYIGNSGLDVGLHYSGLNISGNRGNQNCLPASISNATTLPIPVGVGSAYPPCIAPLIGNPTAGATGFPLMSYVAGHNFERATYDTTYHVVDFEVGYNMQLGRVNVRPFVGARYADFEQTTNFGLNMIYGMAPTPAPPYLLPGGLHAEWERLVSQNGFGPRLGLDAQVDVGSGFGLAGSISGSVLFGDRDSVDSATIAGLSVLNTVGGPPLPLKGRVVEGDGDTFYNAEGDIGLTYSLDLGNASSMMMTVGYRAEVWFDVNNTSNNFTASGLGGLNGAVFPATALGDFGDENADQVFHGPFLRAKLNF